MRRCDSPFLDEALAATLEALGRRTLIVAGFATEAVVLRATLDAIAAGYAAHVPRDACGGSSSRTEDAACRPIERAGGVTTSVVGLITSLAPDFSRPPGADAFEATRDVLAARRGVPSTRNNGDGHERGSHRQVALVTGAAAGIGSATARASARAGASVVLLDRHEREVRDAAAEVAETGDRALGLAYDVGDEAGVAKCVEQAVADFGRIDAAFNNAGVMTERTDAAEADGREFDRVIAINLRCIRSCMKHEPARMVGRGGGAIVNCSSIGGEVGGPGLGACHAAKHGVLGLTKSAALEYARKGVRIDAVLPVIVDTPMNDRSTAEHPQTTGRTSGTVPIGRLAKPEEIASAVPFPCGPGASLVLGHGLAVDGGCLSHRAGAENRGWTVRAALDRQEGEMTCAIPSTSN